MNKDKSNKDKSDYKWIKNGYTQAKDENKLESWCSILKEAGNSDENIKKYLEEKGYCKDDSHSNNKPNEDKTEMYENFSMMNDSTSMNSILVFGLFIILFLFVYIYGFHGILKFEKNLNYLIAILFSAFGIILSIMLIIGVIRHVSSSTMSDEEKGNSRNALLVVAILVVFFSMMAIIRYNYGKLFK